MLPSGFWVVLMSGIFKVWDAKCTHLINHLLHMSFSAALSTENVKSLLYCLSKPHFIDVFKVKLCSFLIQTQHLRHSPGTRLCMPTIPLLKHQENQNKVIFNWIPFQAKPAGILWNNHWAEQLYLEINDYFPFLCSSLLLISVLLRPDTNST